MLPSFFWGACALGLTFLAVLLSARCAVRLTAPDGRRLVYVLPLRRSDGPVEPLLRWGYGCLRSGTMAGDALLVVLDLGLDEDQSRVLRLFCDRHAGVLAATPDTLADAGTKDIVCILSALVLY